MPSFAAMAFELSLSCWTPVLMARRRHVIASADPELVETFTDIHKDVYVML